MAIKVSIEKLHSMFFNEGKSASAIANAFKVDKSYISRVLKQEFLSEYQEEKEKRKLENKAKQSSNKNLDKDREIYDLYFVQGKKVVEIADIIGKDHSYVTKALQSYPEYSAEKERRKALNREKNTGLENFDECHYHYRERPLMPYETIGILSFIQFNRQSYITDKKGRLIFDESRGKRPFDAPKIYKPVI